MTAEIFWEYIELVQGKLPKFHNNRAYENYQTQLIKQALIKQSFQEVVNFNIAYTKKVDELFSPNVIELYAVSYLSFRELKDGQVYISNDGFRDFRD